jgi:hypothetical protein
MLPMAAANKVQATQPDSSSRAEPAKKPARSAHSLNRTIIGM